MTDSSDIKIVVDDIFESSAQTLVNTVNTEGVMGKGIALEFRKRFPDMHDDYVRRCKLHQVRLGEPYLYRGLHNQWVLNFPTKQHWRSHSRLSDIEAGLRYLYRHYREWGITSLAVPPLGSGLGGLEWRVVGRVLYSAFRHFEIPVELYAPFGTPDDQLTPEFLSRSEEDSPLDAGPVRLPPAWVALIEVLDEIEGQPYRWPVGRVAFQKIAYFATEAGVPTELEFAKKSYGPFAANLAKLKSALINNGLLTESRLGRMMQLTPGPALEHARDAYGASLDQWRDAIAKVADLFLRIDTREAEVAATAHFAAKQLARRRRPTELEVLVAVKEWKARRSPRLTDEEVSIAIRNLRTHGWIDAEESPDLPLPVDYRAESIVNVA
jgi:O-acetyl-ADP-ribose deacetylase (regulator of RNase III)/uncharacterized protein YwgA